MSIELLALSDAILRMGGGGGGNGGGGGGPGVPGVEVPTEPTGPFTPSRDVIPEPSSVVVWVVLLVVFLLGGRLWNSR